MGEPRHVGVEHHLDLVVLDHDQALEIRVLDRRVKDRLVKDRLVQERNQRLVQEGNVRVRETDEKRRHVGKIKDGKTNGIAEIGDKEPVAIPQFVILMKFLAFLERQHKMKLEQHSEILRINIIQIV